MIMVVAVAAFLAGCVASSPVRIVPLVGAPAYPPTDAASVAVLSAQPQIPYETLGQIVLEPEDMLPVPDMERMLRKAGASMGANAVVIMDDMYLQADAGPATKPRSQVVSAIAIRYK